MPLVAALPDVALTDLPPAHGPLDWVGMQHIELPVQVAEPGCLGTVAAQADVQVDLPDAATKGIHMSRLYRLLDLLEGQALTPASLARVLAQMVESHADCQSRQARLQLAFTLLCRRPALVSSGLSGWKGYPVRLRAHWHAGVLQLRARVEVGYSSTCPCSAALARQVVEQRFLDQFGQRGGLGAQEVAAWLRANASAATPHSQRSVASIEVSIAGHAGTLGLMALIDQAEAALGTPLQTAVKRADEQAFAQLNGEHLMYVEDAARKLTQALQATHDQVQVFVSHRESLHPHDAVAWASPPP